MGQLQEAQRFRHPRHFPWPSQIYSSLPRMQQGQDRISHNRENEMIPFFVRREQILPMEEES